MNYVHEDPRQYVSRIVEVSIYVSSIVEVSIVDVLECEDVYMAEQLYAQMSELDTVTK